SLTATDPLALNADFGPTNCNGTYHLDTPTTADTSDWASGIWYYDYATNVPTLHLPDLPIGWEYDLWCGTTGQSDPIPYGLGTFGSANGADSDGGGCSAGPVPAPPFPGEDFILNCYPWEPVPPVHLNSGGWGLTVAIQPDPPTGPNPFHSLEP